MEQIVEFVWWCPRCGTIKGEWQATKFAEAPKLVERCREFEAKTLPHIHKPILDAKNDWHRLGIAEAIHLPKDRA